MKTLFDAYVSFPATSEYSLGTLDRLVKLCESVEMVEQYFNIEFSCGDGKYYNDYYYWTEGGSLAANYHTEEDYENVAKYDGKVCYESVPRFRDTKELFKADKDYNFSIKSKETDDGDRVTFYINEQKRSTHVK